jgi:hypothetical protein
MFFIVLEWERYLVDMPVCCQMIDQLKWISKELVIDQLKWIGKELVMA